MKNKCIQCNNIIIKKNITHKFCSKKCCDKNYRENNKLIMNKYSENYRENNKDYFKKYNIKYYNENKELIKNRSVEYFKKNLKRCKKTRKEYYLNNKNNCDEMNKKWKENNKEQYKEWTNIYRKNRESYDIGFKISNRMRHRVYLACIAKKAKKNYKFKEYLGCSIAELMIYLENKFQDGMSWDNYGKNGWEIDHIRPCASFDLSKSEEQLKCFNYKNLQPLWLEDNLKKGGKYNG